MKALTIIQPWATLLAAGKKRMETRSWKTNYRGEILLHAGGMRFNYFSDVCHGRKDLKSYFEGVGIGSDADLQTLPFKAIVGKAVLVNCVQIDALTAEFIRKQHPEEYAFGDFTPGRYAWIMEHAVLFKKPVPASGKQGLWNWDPVFVKHANVGKTEEFLNELAKYKEILGGAI